MVDAPWVLPMDLGRMRAAEAWFAWGLASLVVDHRLAVADMAEVWSTVGDGSMRAADVPDAVANVVLGWEMPGQRIVASAMSHMQRRSCAKVLCQSPWCRSQSAFRFARFDATVDVDGIGDVVIAACRSGCRGCSRRCRQAPPTDPHRRR